MRLIDADELKKNISVNVGKSGAKNLYLIQRQIEEAPTIDSHPVTIQAPTIDVRIIADNHAHWETIGKEPDISFKCSNCNAISDGLYNFCAECGAQMFETKSEPVPQSTKKTNYEKIKQMSFDEMVDFVEEYCGCNCCEGQCSEISCEEGKRKWLESEVDENG